MHFVCSNKCINILDDGESYNPGYLHSLPHKLWFAQDARAFTSTINGPFCQILKTS
jgi:hypothetical protein